MHGRRLGPLIRTSSAAWLLLAGLGTAAELPISASYGNRNGCTYALTGQGSTDDDFYLLTKDSITTAVAQCTFLDVRSRPDNGFDLTVQCEEEGWTEDLAPFEISIDAAGSDSFMLNIDDGSSWGPLALCR